MCHLPAAGDQAETHIKVTEEDLAKHRSEVESNRQETDRLRCVPPVTGRCRRCFGPQLIDSSAF